MYLSTMTSILLLAIPLGVLASPTPNDSGVSVAGIGSVGPANTLVKRADQCEGEYRVGLNRWNIWIDNDNLVNGACGSGCLDNIRGRCGSVTDWGCERNADNRAYYHFNTVVGCTAYDMTQALNACTSRNIACSL